MSMPPDYQITYYSTTTEVCCFRLTTGSRSRQNDLFQKEMFDRMRDTNAKFTKMVQRIREMFDQLVSDSKYGSLGDLADDFDKRYGGELRAKALLFYQSEGWVNNRTRKFRRKIVLAYKQGLAPNRCDSVVYSIDELTEDHITPKSGGGSGNMKELQLLYRKCNQEKDDSTPTERDISPFSFHGQLCLHRITCVEVDNLRLSYERDNKGGVSSDLASC